MHDWANLWAWEERRAELVREVEHRRLVRELRKARGLRVKERSGGGYAELGDGGIEVREEEPAAGRWKRLLGASAGPFVGLLRE